MKSIIGGLGLGLAALLAAPLPSFAADNASCFFKRDWTSWNSPAEDVIYLKVGFRDVYRVTLRNAPRLDKATSVLVSDSPGSTICSSLDLNLTLVERGGIRAPLFVASLTKLSPEEVEAIPLKARP